MIDKHNDKQPIYALTDTQPIRILSQPALDDTRFQIGDDGELINIHAKNKNRPHRPRTRITRYLSIFVLLYVGGAIGIVMTVLYITYVLLPQIRTDMAPQPAAWRNVNVVSFQPPPCATQTQIRPSIGFITTPGAGKAYLNSVDLRSSTVCPMASNVNNFHDFAWSPDARRIVFLCSNTVCLVNNNGQNLNQLDPLQLGPDAVGLDWSPNGLHFILSMRSQNDADCLNCGLGLYMMDADGSHMRRVSAKTPYNDTSPRWSADSQKIAFVSNRTGHPEIYVMNADGSNTQQITALLAETGDPDWSPDGKSIAFASYKNGNYDIYTIGIDGTNLRQLTDNPARDYQPTWSPDGKSIAFSSYRNWTNQIFVMNSDGSNQQALTPSTLNANYPRWMPFSVR